MHRGRHAGSNPVAMSDELPNANSHGHARADANRDTDAEPGGLADADAAAGCIGRANRYIGTAAARYSDSAGRRAGGNSGSDRPACDCLGQPERDAERAAHSNDSSDADRSGGDADPWWLPHVGRAKRLRKPDATAHARAAVSGNRGSRVARFRPTRTQ